MLFMVSSVTMDKDRISVMSRTRTAVWPGHRFEPNTVASLFEMSTRSRVHRFSMSSIVNSLSQGGGYGTDLYELLWS